MWPGANLGPVRGERSVEGGAGRHAHRSCAMVARYHVMPDLTRPKNTQGSDEIPQTPALRHRLPPDGSRRPRQESGPGRTHGDGYWLQRGRLAPRRRRFGEVTSRTRHQRPYPSGAVPFLRPFPRPLPDAGPQLLSSVPLLDSSEDLRTIANGKGAIDTEGSQIRTDRCYRPRSGGQAAWLCASAGSAV
jgi:hypothetical protein